MGFLDGVMGNASRLDPQAAAQEYGRLLAQGEQVHAAYLLVRGTRAACQGRCMLGQSRPTACTPGSARVRLRILDTYGGTGHDDTDAGCLQHAAGCRRLCHGHPDGLFADADDGLGKLYR